VKLRGFAKKMKRILSMLSAAQLLQGCATQKYWPKEALVPDAATAIKIAEAVCWPLFEKEFGKEVGKRELETERPFRATLENEIWLVRGTLPTNLVGGVAIVRISKRDGRILEVGHGK
jgi:hypothetical protein